MSEEYSGIFGGLIAADKLEEFIQKQKDAGIDDIIAECQKQLSEWKAANP